MSSIDWHLVAQVGVPVGTLFLGAWVNRWFENRPTLTSYYGHVSAFQHTLPDSTRAAIYTHTVVLRNTGRKSATNVRLRHAVLPSFQIFPSVNYSVVDLPDGAKEVLIPTLVPQEQLTISYLYFPPLTYEGVNAGIRSDDGLARQIPVLLQRQYPRWLNALVGLFLLIGLLTAAYLAVLAVRHLGA